MIPYIFMAHCKDTEVVVECLSWLIVRTLGAGPHTCLKTQRLLLGVLYSLGSLSGLRANALLPGQDEG